MSFGDCTEKCRSFKHGQDIVRIATIPSYTDLDVLTIWKNTCNNFMKVRDDVGKNSLLVSASAGRSKVVEWLIKREGSDINVKDATSGYTSLHRSIFFGHINVARTLIKLGALSLADNEGYFPLDLLSLDKPKWGSGGDDVKHSVNEVFVWGNNENYNLGIGTDQVKPTPELLDRTKKLGGYLGSCFTQVAMDKYHTVFLQSTGKAFTCGFGVGGRLGHDNEYTCFIPTRIDSIDDCEEVAVGLDHTLFRMVNGTIKSCGSNDNFALGHRHAVKKVLKPKYVDLPTKSVIGISASRLHSVFLTASEVFVCGTNSGQMGFDETVKTIMKPKRISCPFETESPTVNVSSCFTHVTCNEYATVVAHSRGNICIFRKYTCFTLNTRHFDIEKIQVVGGGSGSQDRTETDTCGALCIFVLLKHGRLLIWRENLEPPVMITTIKRERGNSQFTLAVFNIGRALTIRSMCASNSSLVLISQGGEGFKAALNLGAQPITVPNMHDPSARTGNGKSGNEWGFLHKHSLRHCSGKDPFCSLPLETIKLKKLANIYQGLQAFCDPRGTNFAITQLHQKAEQTNLPMIKKTEMNEDFGLLLKEASPEDDVHDVVFKVGTFQFPAHRFIIAATCDILYKEVKRQPQHDISAKNPVNVLLKDIEPRVFEQILQFLYTNTCDIFVPGRFSCYSNDPNWVDLMKILSRKLQLRALTDRLQTVRMQGNKIEFLRSGSAVPDLKFDKNSLKNLCDLDLVSEDGHTVAVHQCVIVARLEYFRNMLQQNRWLEGNQSRAKLKFPGSKDVMDIFLDLIYRGTCDHHVGVATKKDLDILSQALVTSDLLLAPQFLSHFEYLLADYINVENASEILNLAELCNSLQLKETCMEFICLNLAQMLENRLLDLLSEEIMKEIGYYYRNVFTHIESRKHSSADSFSVMNDDEYQTAKEKSDETFELLDTIEEAEFITPKKSQSSKAKIKSRPTRTRTLSNSSCNNDFNANSDICDVESSPQYTSPQRINESQGHHFTPVVRKNLKSSPPPQTKDVTSTPQTRRITIPMPNNKSFKISPSPSNSVTLNMNDFPSVEDACSTGFMRKLDIKSSPSFNHATSIDPSSPPSPSPMISSTVTSRRKTKWVALNKEAMSHRVAGETDYVDKSAASGRDLLNPWQKLAATATTPKEQASTSNIESSSSVRFDDIVQHERLKNENLQKAIAKPLFLSQIEDEALNQLWKRYTSQDVVDGYELLQVERVSLADDYAIPVWRKSTVYNQ